MPSANEPSSTSSPNHGPTMTDSEMGSSRKNDYIDSFDPAALLDASAPDANRELEQLFLQAGSAPFPGSTSCLSPNELTLNGNVSKSSDAMNPASYPSDTQSDSPVNSSHASSADSPVRHLRDTSINSNPSGIFSPGSAGAERFQTNGWSNGDDLAANQDGFLNQDADSSFLKTDFSMDGDIELSNKAMNSAFDFDSAASSPSPLKMDTAPESNGKSHSSQPSHHPNAGQHHAKSNSSQFGFPASPFVFQGSRMPSSSFPVENGQQGSNYWEGFTPPPAERQDKAMSLKAENNRSSLDSTLSHSLDFGCQTQRYDHMHYAGGQIPAKTLGDFNFQPNRTPGNRPRPTLIVHPTSLKSRVETQIPIKLTLYPFPFGVKKLRLPSHAISKPKFLAKLDTEKDTEILELSASVVCTSAMQDTGKRKRAFARAGGEDSNGAASAGVSVDEETPLDGADVKICPGCIQRERKRASRKKQRKPEEDELFQKDEDKRIVVFNTTELKDWVESPKSPASDPATQRFPASAMHVELPMRIACYCRHQNEKQGFQVIFTIKDHLDNVLAQTITNSIMITDDHKTHPSAQGVSATATSAVPESRRPTAGVFAAASKGETSFGRPPYRLSHSATDLQALRGQQHAAMASNASTNPSDGTSGSASSTPKSLSRQASPTDMPGPSSKRRKQSRQGRVPTNLAMTQMEPAHAAGDAANNATYSSLAANVRSVNGQPDLPFVMPSSHPPHFAPGPPTPGNNESSFVNQAEGAPQPPDNHSFASLVSASSSAQPSRPGSPNGSRGATQDQNVGSSTSGPNMASQTWSMPPSMPQRLPTMIHKLVPAEGSTTGGNEVTILGSGFAPGMELVFGDTLATTTTFWGDKCLNCLTPPALQPGTVPVVFRHEHPRFGGQQQAPPMLPKQQNWYRYVDDRELQMYRLALGILGQKLRNPTDAFHTAQQIMGSDPSMPWNFNNLSRGGGGQNQHNSGSSQDPNMSDLDGKMLVYLEFMDLDDSPRSPKFGAVSPAGQTLLHYASSLGLTRFVAGLLARGADPNVPDHNGNTPMHLAALHGHSHIIHRLRLSGARANAESQRGFTAADLATTLPAHQAVLLPAHHYRSRSVDSTQPSRRRPSSASLDMPWETSSSDGLFDSTSSSDEIDEDSTRPTMGYSRSRRASVDHVTPSPRYISRSREASVTRVGVPQQPNETASPEDAVEGGFSPPAALVAWRDQLAGQIQQFQQNVNWAFPNLPALPPMPALPDYQTYPMMQRITSLVPPRPTTAWSTSIMRDGWDRLTGNSSPPAYEELYPIEEAGEDQEEDIKKTSMVQAAADAALDQHFETQSESRASSPESGKEDIRDLRIGRKNISRHQQEQLRKTHARKVKKIRSDHNLFLIWIPLLVLIAVAMLRNFIPNIGSSISQGYQFVKTRYLTPTGDVDVTA